MKSDAVYPRAVAFQARAHILFKASLEDAPSAGNIEGALHVPGYMDRKKRKVRKFEPRTLFIKRPVLNGESIVAWAKSVGFPTVLLPDDLHVTIMFSRQLIDWETLGISIIPMVVNAGDRSIASFDDSATVLRFESQELGARWRQIKDLGVQTKFPDYKPHITISYDAPKEAVLWEPYRGPIVLGAEEFQEVKKDYEADIIEKLSTVDWADDMEKVGARHSKSDIAMLQTMHDHSVKLGASCGSQEADKETIEKFRIAKVDESLGLVFGYAIICKANGQDYYDLNIDADSGQRVPEHIPEATMLKAASDFMQNSRAGNEMHSGPDAGTFVFAFPLTSDIAKALGVQTNVTGLLVGFKPPPELLSKFKDGTYKGFSIEGKRISVQEIE